MYYMGVLCFKNKETFFIRIYISIKLREYFENIYF